MKGNKASECNKQAYHATHLGAGKQHENTARWHTKESQHWRLTGFFEGQSTPEMPWRCLCTQERNECIALWGALHAWQSSRRSSPWFMQKLPARNTADKSMSTS